MTTIAEDLARLVSEAEPDWIPPEVRDRLKICILDAIGCALGALGEAVPHTIRALETELTPDGSATLIGGGRISPDRAAFCNGALVRYLDFNDSYLAAVEALHPSDNLAPVLAAAESANAGGDEFLLALAIAYQVLIRLADAAPVLAKGFDHTALGSFAVAAGAARALRLNPAQTANAIAIAGTAFHALRVTRTGEISHWKGLAYPNTALGAVHATLLAARGITGPLAVFEGTKGFMDTITGKFPFSWRKEDFARPLAISFKPYNAAISAQSAIEGLLELRRSAPIDPLRIAWIDVEIYQRAFDVIGGGIEGSKHHVRTKEEADHSLPYILAAALLDGELMPQQYEPERIVRADVQRMIERIRIHPSAEYTRRYPGEMCVRLVLTETGGAQHAIEKSDYLGFPTRPMDWNAAVEKFGRLSASRATSALRQEIVDHVQRLEEIPVSALTALLARAE